MCGASSSFHMPYSSRRFLVRGCTGKTMGMGLFLNSYEVAEGLGVVHVFGSVEGD